MFYLFVQNNSFGRYVIDAEAGIGVNVAFEANSEEEAIERAKNVIYFDGVSKGIDCGCCGDRWSDYCIDNGETIEEISKWKYDSFSEDSTMYVHMFDGTILAVK